MTPLRKARWFAVTITVVAAFAWVLASNHCAFAAMKVTSEAEHACCHEQAPADPEPSTQCCAALNVPIPDHAGAPVALLHEVKPAWVAASAEIFAPRPAVTFLECDADPPRQPLALHSALSRCQPAHAPPHFVA